MQAQIESLSTRVLYIETELTRHYSENRKEMDRRAASQKEWIEKLEGQVSKTSDTVIRIEGKIKGLERSVDSMRKTAGKLVWAMLTPVLAAIGLGLVQLLK